MLLALFQIRFNFEGGLGCTLVCAVRSDSFELRDVRRCALSSFPSPDNVPFALPFRFPNIAARVKASPASLTAIIFPEERVAINAMPTTSSKSSAIEMSRIRTGLVSHLNQDSFFPKKTLKRAITGGLGGAL